MQLQANHSLSLHLDNVYNIGVSITFLNNIYVLFQYNNIKSIKYLLKNASCKPDYKIGICCFSAKHAAPRRKSKDWLVLNQDNVSEWSDMSIRRLCFNELAL